MGTLIGMAVAAGIVAFVIFIFRLHKKQLAELAAALTQAGYQAVPQLDHELEEALRDLSAHGRKTKMTLTNVYKHSGRNYDLYRYDVPGSDSTDTRYAMDFRHAVFPPFATVPNVKLPGLLGSLANKLFQLAIGRLELKEVEVPGKPRFREKYRLYAAEPRQLLSAIPAHVWERLTDLPGHLCLSGKGRALLLTSIVPVQNRSSNNTGKDLRSMVETADALWHVFSEVRPARMVV